ncbi:MAG: methyltransferase [Weeksellaceae bacterium]|nr:methyltransferase [Weeksellaceae bacterium]
MKPFRFQQFQINQHTQVFRVGTDGLLLGAICDVSNATNALEVGGGTGLVSLMLAQRNPQVKITALDINAEASELAGQNFQNSPFADRLISVHGDFKDYVPQDERFNLIVSNPPYFDENTSDKDRIARQTLELDGKLIISKSASMLSADGFVSLIIPAEHASDLEAHAGAHQLFPVRKVNIYGIAGGPLKRNILEFSRRQGEITTEEFIIEKSPRKYSDQYLKLTEGFHVFSDSLS